jgi:hypothetical protein
MTTLFLADDGSSGSIRWLACKQAFRQKVAAVTLGHFRGRELSGQGWLRPFCGAFLVHEQPCLYEIRVEVSDGSYWNYQTGLYSLIFVLQ